MGRTVRLNHKDHTALIRADMDCREIGRIRTSSELFGADTRARDGMLRSMRALEVMGFVERREKAWSSGHVTDAGRYFLLSTPLPKPRKSMRTWVPRGLAADGGTWFKKALVEAGDSPILINGGQSYKLGGSVRKGRLKGYPIRYVTLEEGRTCPASCSVKNECYGGNMPLAKRIIWRGAATGKTITAAIRAHSPILLRLHSLGDFPSVDYAGDVLLALRQAGSFAFGYTHHQPETPIGANLRTLAEQFWHRFAIRTSYLHGSRAPIPHRSAVIVESPGQAAQHNAILCPEQQGRVDNCGRCGLCWHTQRPIAFLLHGRTVKAAKLAPALHRQPVEAHA